MAHEAGKGSGRRKEDVKKIHDNWDLIFKPKGNTVMNNHDEDTQEHNEDASEWTCDSCGGPMYRQAHWSYGKCDDCGATQELINDDYI